MDPFLQKGDEAFSRGNFDYALRLYRDYCRTFPYHVEARLKLRLVEMRRCELGWCSFGWWGRVRTWFKTKYLCWQVWRGNFGSGIDLCEDILEICPCNGRVLFLLGVCLACVRDVGTSVGHVDGAISVLSKLKVDCGGDRRVYVDCCRLLGELLEGQRKFKEALEVWSCLLRVVPGDREGVVKVRDLGALIAHDRMAVSCEERREDLGGLHFEIRSTMDLAQ